MQTQTMQQQTGTVLTERDVVNKLRSYAIERKYALKAYQYATGAAEKLEAVEQVLIKLEIAELQSSPKQVIKTVMTCALDLHFIAPRATKKLYQTWYEKIEAIMQACRDYL
ncbi:hypothetical protein SAMN05192574_101356 [Mucilaginibacter gossypiicola]|uniref:Uncharacterized protein n=1 Tax=Mucilaginibacter gossypiicola TaxID=551995 RepID=A0A1H8A414_9SPHI|nr:hypothetical protein [Mucilaginibacter gossypiicola]SEM65632.1 hypothetical protein SAMN05192574_101356 [Mucilaginibacter gossypiicola]